MKQRTPLKRISDKKLAANGGKVPFSSITAQPKKIRVKKRKPSEFARIYGSKERVAWVKSLACLIAGREAVDGGLAYCMGEIQNAHVETGGTSRKANANRIVPLCGRHHHTLHQVGMKTFEQTYTIDLHAEADLVAAHWHQRESTQP